MLPITHNRPRIPHLSRSEKNRIVAQIREGYDAYCRQSPIVGEHAARAGDCFWLAIYGSTMLKNILEIDVRVSAGSLSWPRVRLPRADDGKILTHFSYIFEPNSPQTVEKLMRGEMPEMHVWIAIPPRGEIIDLSTRNLRAQCERIGLLQGYPGGMPWLNDDPPDYLWCHHTDMPKYVRYEPSMQAVEIVKAMADAVFGRAAP